MTFTTRQQEFQYRVSIKRQLRAKGIEFDKESATETLEQLLKESNNENEVEVTFDRFSPKHLAGKTVKAIKHVGQYTTTFHGDYGHVQAKTIESVSYIYKGQSYGSEFFI